VRLLLDTHIWVWSLLDPARLPSHIAAALESRQNELWLSPISIWEFLILVEKGRLAVDGEPEAWIARALAAVPCQEAPLTREVAIRSRSVDLPHQDPADRFLVATALVYDLTFVTVDDLIVRSKNLLLLIP
jgi:PIN domain nuclease of toxin-antitoxin system